MQLTKSHPFVDEQKGECTMGHIRFKDGTLAVPKEKQKLTKTYFFIPPIKSTNISRI